MLSPAPALKSRILIFALLASGGSWSFAQEEPSHAPPPTPVRVETVREGLLAPRKRVFGELRAAQQSTLAFQESGIVRELLVREGQAVLEGMVIARLDATRIGLELRVNAANRALASTVILEQEAVLARAVRDLALIKKAESVGGTNVREVADSESDLSIAQAKLEAAHASLAVEAASLAVLEQRLRDHELRAPFAGVITKRHADTGAWLGEGAAVVDLQATDHLRAWLEVPQEFYEPMLAFTKAAPEQSRASGGEEQAHGSSAIEIRDALDHPLQTTTVSFVPSVDPRSRSFPVILDVRADGAKLAAGIALTGFIPSGALANRLIVSRDAVLHGDAGPFLFVVRDDVAVPLQVRIDFPIGDDVAIEADGLTVGSRVVTEGNERLIPMSRVAPIADATPLASEGSK